MATGRGMASGLYTPRQGQGRGRKGERRGRAISIPSIFLVLVSSACIVLGVAGGLKGVINGLQGRGQQDQTCAICLTGREKGLGR